MWVDKKIPGFVIFYAEAIKNNWFFEKQWWVGLKFGSISEANLCRGSKNSFYKRFLKNFVEFTEKDLSLSLFFKTFCNFKRRHWHKCFPLNSEIFLKYIFLQNTFRSLLLLLEKPLRNPWEITTKPTTRILL